MNFRPLLTYNASNILNLVPYRSQGPWARRTRADASKWGYGMAFSGAQADLGRLGLGEDFYHQVSVMKGNPYDGSFAASWGVIEGLGGGVRHPWSNGKFGEVANLAASVQENLEASTIALVESLKSNTSSTNFCFTGGVALNSVLNGRIVREGGFEEVYIPPCPGDEGISVGCALYGLQRFREETDFLQRQPSKKRKEEQIFSFVSPLASGNSPVGAAETVGPPILHSALSPYQGRLHSEEDIEEALDEYRAFITQRFVEKEEDLVEACAEMLAGGAVLAWYQGRSELGQRALGSRSFLADPRDTGMRQHINDLVKEREWWRPLAPSVLAEKANEWFHMLSSTDADTSSTSSSSNASPYMQLTTYAREDKAALVPAVLHVDNSARLQVVSLCWLIEQIHVY